METIPRATDRRTGGFRRYAGLDSSRPFTSAGFTNSGFATTKGASRDKTPVGMTSPTSWETQTVRQVTVAGANRNWATGARWTTTETQDRSNFSVNANNSAINEALVSKTAETQKLYELLQDTLRTVNGQISVMESLPAKRLAAYLRQTEEKLELNGKRLEVRKSRPKNELVDDEVHGQLLTMDANLRQRLAQLHHCQKAVAQDLRLLSESKHDLEADIAAKRAALSVDNNVLTHNLDVSVTTRSNSPGGHKMTIHPGMWTGNTQAIVRTALQRQADAAKLHLACDNVCQESATEEKSNRQSLHIKTMDKINKTKSLQQMLEMERAQVTDELNRVESKEMELCNHILDLEDTITQTKDRYNYRCQRPDREKVVDEVELQMKKTLKEQKALHSNLMMSKPTLAANIAGLRRNQAALDRNIQEKGECLMVDEQSLLVDGRRAASIAPSNASYRTAYGGTVTSAGQAYSPRGGSTGSRSSSLKSRISALEDELNQTRMSNEALLKKRDQLSMK